MTSGVHVLPVRVDGEVSEHTPLAETLLTALRDADLDLLDGDVLVVSSKVVSKAAGLVAPAAMRADVVAGQTVRVVATRRTPRGTSAIVQATAGPVMASAGVDESNTVPGSILWLPPDPDGAARDLRRQLRAAGAPAIAVVVSDTAGRPWRTGQTDFALGAAGLVVIDDLRGTNDATGQVLEVTERAVADEIAAAADLVKGKSWGNPAAVVRGMASFVVDDDGPGAASLLRDSATDWFRYGHVEAARAALGVPTGAVEPPSVSPEPVRHRALRAVQVALLPEPSVEATVYRDDDSAPLLISLRGNGFECGLVVQRLLVALWAEDLEGSFAAPAAPGDAAIVSVCQPGRASPG